MKLFLFQDLKIPLGAADGPNVVRSNHESKESSLNVTLIKRCELTAKDALSALSRATTHQCKQDIIDTACRNEAGTLYVKRLKRTCPFAGMSVILYYIKLRSH